MRRARGLRDLDAVGRHLVDRIVEPQRKVRIPGFDAASDAARAAGALGGSISGSGPSVFAWCRRDRVDAVAAALLAAFTDAGHECDVVRSPVDAPGAYVIPAQSKRGSA